METMITHALIVLFGTRILPLVLSAADEVFLKDKEKVSGKEQAKKS